MRGTMKRRKLIDLSWKLLQRINTCTAMVLPPAVAGITVLLLMSYGVGGEVVQIPSPIGWTGYIPKLPTDELLAALTVLMAVGATFVTYQKASKYSTIANGSTVTGIAIPVVLSWATPLCNQTGGIVAGLTAAGTIVIVATVVGVLTGRIKWGMNLLQPIGEPREGREGLIWVMHIGMAIFMGFVILIAVSYEELSPPARPLLLVFAGIGLTAAAAITSENSFKNYMAIAGMIASLVGAYMQIDQAIAATGRGDVSALDIMFAVIILGFAPFTIFASPQHRLVRNLTVPLLAAAIVAFLNAFAIVIPAILIASGCNAGDNLQLIVLAVVWCSSHRRRRSNFLGRQVGADAAKRETPNVDEWHDCSGMLLNS